MQSERENVIDTKHNKWNFDSPNFIEFLSEKNQVHLENCCNSASRWLKLFSDVSNTTYRCWKLYKTTKFDIKGISHLHLATFGLFPL